MSDKPQDDDAISQPRDRDETELEANTTSPDERGVQRDNAAHDDRQENDVAADKKVPATAKQDEAAAVVSDADEIQANRRKHLRQSIMNAQSLLAFSAEANVAVPDEVVDSITAAQKAFVEDTWTPEVERSFWSAFCNISGLLLPVTSSSLRWVAAQGKKITLVFSFLGILSLVALIFGQIFWVYITNTSTQIRKSTETLTLKTAEAAMLTGTVELLTLQLYSSKEVALSGESRKQLQEALAQSTAKNEALSSVIGQFKRLLAAQYVILADWVPEFAGDPRPPGPGWFDSEQEIVMKQKALDAWQEKRQSERGFEKEYLLAQADSILALMSIYILPVLYGVLGTFAYILRSISRSIQERVLNESMVLNFWVRIPLGMLSGVAVGWFLDTTNLPTGWEAVQPLAIAFVAGYSVELIFTGMDRLVGAFSGRHQPGTP